jgi:UDP-GlcNAc:undecaprenyl-phosphate GlcNAc-1-phosphate transferase
MLDNMDAITTTVSIFILFSAMIAAWVSPDFNHFYMTSLVGVTGALLAFLFFNWHPSKMFMGDTGSQFLGIFLAAIAIIFFWNNKGIEDSPAQSKQIVIVLLTFIIPICDTTTVIINRLRRRQSPFIGGKDHTTHHLSYLGLSDGNVARILALVSLISYLLVYLIVNNYYTWDYGVAFLFFGYFIAVFGALFSVTQIPKAKKKFESTAAAKQAPK